MSAAALRIVDGATPVFDDGTTAWTLPIISIASPSLASFTIFNGTQQEIPLDCSGIIVALGDFTYASFSGDLQGVALTANYDSDNNFLLAELRNDTGGDVTLNGTLYGFVMKAF